MNQQPTAKTTIRQPQNPVRKPEQKPEGEKAKSRFAWSPEEWTPVKDEGKK